VGPASVYLSWLSNRGKLIAESTVESWSPGIWIYHLPGSLVEGEAICLSRAVPKVFLRTLPHGSPSRQKACKRRVTPGGNGSDPAPIEEKEDRIHTEPRPIRILSRILGMARHSLQALNPNGAMALPTVVNARDQHGDQRIDGRLIRRHAWREVAMHAKSS